MSNDETENNVPQWAIYAGISIASLVAYKALANPNKFVHEHEHFFNNSLINADDYLPRMRKRNEKYYSTNPWDAVPIKLSKEGPASRPPNTVFELFKKSVDNNPNAICWKKEYLINGSDTDYEWKSFTRKEVYDLTLQTARSFIACGLKPWQGVSIIGFNSPEWLFSKLGAIHAGGIVAGIYTTNKEQACRHIASHSKSAVAVVENKKQLIKFLNIRQDLPDLQVIVVWDIDKNDEIILKSNKNQDYARIMHWDDFIKLGNNIDTIQTLDKEMNKRIATITPGQCCTLIYTSGTTGKPKAVMISHDNITWSSCNVLDSIKCFTKEGPHSIISYLPLSHIAAQLLDVYAPIVHTANYPECESFIVYFARPTALKGTLGLTIKEARPTIFFGVPRVWEKIAEAIKKKSAQNPPSLPMKLLLNWMKSTILAGNLSKQVDGDMIKPFGYNLSVSLLVNKVKRTIGFDRLQVAYTGAAPTPMSVVKFWCSLGINILEVYGMSESCGAHTLSIPYYFKFGSVGITLNGLETLIDHVNEGDQGDRHDKPGQGEICMRGRHVMMGYMYDEDKTKQVIDDEGYLHSGDIGTIHNKWKYINITGRLKELLITHGGENIAPVPIEDFIKEKCEKGLSNVMVIGDHKKYLTCLITLKVQQNLNTMLFTDQLDGNAKDIDKKCKTVQDAKKSRKWKEYIQNGIDSYNAQTISNAQTIKYYRIVNNDFGVETGELTSTMKLKRSVVAEKHKELIDTMYGANIQKQNIKL